MLRLCVATFALCLLFAFTYAENPQGQYFNRGGVSLYAETTTHSDESLPTMLFIHGSGGSTKIWSGAVDYYKRKFPTLAVDLRGHARSDGPLDSPYSFAMFSDDVHFILQQLGITKVICVGGNFGANVCLQLEYDHHDTITFHGRVLSGGTMLTVGTTAQYDYIEITPGVLDFYICPTINSTIVAPGNPGYMFFLDATGKAVFCDQCYNLDELRQAVVVDGSLAENPLLQMRKLGCFGQNPNAWVFNDQRPLLPFLASRNIPTKVIIGAENIAFSRANALYVSMKLVPPTGAVRPAGKSSPLVNTVPGHGNFVYASDVDEFTAQVDELLDYIEYGPQLFKCDIIKV